jgi:hypothetical protein
VLCCALLCCSYWDIMLQPILNAANAAFKQKGKTFHFSMGGAQPACVRV